MNASKLDVWCAVLVLQGCAFAAGEDPVRTSSSTLEVSSGSASFEPLEHAALPMSYSDSEGDDPKKAGCLYGYSDARCRDDEPRVRGDECPLSDPTELREAFAEMNGNACAANACCPDYKVIAYDCPTVCGHSGDNKYKCKIARDHCGTGQHSAYCDCTGGGGVEIDPPVETVTRSAAGIGL